MQMNTTYKELYDSVFSKLKDYDLFKLSENEAYEIMSPYLKSGISKFKSCKKDLSNRDDELQEFNFVLDDVEFEILSNYILLEYIDSNYIRTTIMLRSYLSNSDFHKYDNKDMLNKVIEMRQMYMSETKQLMIDYSYSGSRLFTISKKNRRYIL